MRAFDAGTGVQKLKCAGGNDGWVNEMDGSKNATPLTCLPGCEMISSNEMKNAAFVTQISSTNIVSFFFYEFICILSFFWKKKLVLLVVEIC